MAKSSEVSATDGGLVMGVASDNAPSPAEGEDPADGAIGTRAYAALMIAVH